MFVVPEQVKKKKNSEISSLHYKRFLYEPNCDGAASLQANTNWSAESRRICLLVFECGFACIFMLFSSDAAHILVAT